MSEERKDEYIISDRLRQLATPRKTHRGESPVEQRERSEEQKKVKKLPANELKKSVERLNSSHRKERPLPDLVKHTQLTKEQEASSVKRLCNDAVKAREKRQHEEEQRRLDASAKEKLEKRLDNQEMGEAVSRLYEKAIIQHDESIKSLVRKHAPDMEKAKFDKEKIDQVNTRLYNDSRSRQRDEQEKLFQKYVLEKEPKASKRSAAQIAESAAKLTQKGTRATA